MFGPEQQGKLFQQRVAGEIVKTDLWRDLAASIKNPDLHWLSAIQYLDFKNYLPLDILTKVDRMSMAHSIEARVPLLDHKLVEFAATIPPEYMIRNGSTKDIFKCALQDRLPDSILHRRKQGFAVPLGKWFRGQLTGFVGDLLLSETSRSRGIFNTAYIEKILAMHSKGRDLDLQIWTLISFELWCRTFLDHGGDKRVVNIKRQQPVLVYSNQNINGKIYAQV
jgi:asparagine synthase (glutamine-hydrolysing)